MSRLENLEIFKKLDTNSKRINDIAKQFSKLKPDKFQEILEQNKIQELKLSKAKSFLSKSISETQNIIQVMEYINELEQYITKIQDKHKYLNNRVQGGFDYDRDDLENSMKGVNEFDKEVKKLQENMEKAHNCVKSIYAYENSKGRILENYKTLFSDILSTFEEKNPSFSSEKYSKSSNIQGNASFQNRGSNNSELESSFTFKKEANSIIKSNYPKHSAIISSKIEAFENPKSIISNEERSKNNLESSNLYPSLTSFKELDYGEICSIMIKGVKVSIQKNDITKENVDVIVNACNVDLKHYGGLARAILNKAGRKMDFECEVYIENNVNTGDVVVTGSGDMDNVKYIFHAAGPMYHKEFKDEAPILLQNCIENILTESKKRKIKTISIPAISSGIYGYPKYECASILIGNTFNFLINEKSDLIEVRFTNFDDETVFIRLLRS